MQNSQNDYFQDAPPEGALQTSVKTNYVNVDYGAMKTPAAYVKAVNDDFITDAVLNCKLGFHYYDKLAQKKLPLQPFTFFVLEVYSGLTGSNLNAATSEWSNYWSNRVKDTRTQPYTIWQNGQKLEISGLWADIYEKAQAECKGIKNVRILIAYCKELDTVVEIPLTATAERGVRKGLAKAFQVTRPNTKWQSVLLYGLADNDHIWGFSFKGFERVNEKGDTYAGTGDLYFEPVFDCGVLRGDSPLYATCVEYQEVERGAYATRSENFKKRQAEQTAPQTAVNAGDDFATAEPLIKTESATPDGDSDLPF